MLHACPSQSVCVCVLLNLWHMVHLTLRRVHTPPCVSLSPYRTRSVKRPPPLPFLLDACRFVRRGGGGQRVATTKMTRSGFASRTMWKRGTGRAHLVWHHLSIAGRHGRNYGRNDTGRGNHVAHPAAVVATRQPGSGAPRDDDDTTGSR